MFLRQNGLKHTIKRLIEKAQNRKMQKQLWQLTKLSEEAASQQKQSKHPLKVSILTPLYNTPLNYLQEMITSVQGQTYGNWELCLADASDKDHEDVGEFCKAIAQKDSRIKYLRLEKNRGISENTNACISIATGEYFALLDHDDVLHPAALYEVMQAVYTQNADFVYTDEAKFTEDTSKFFAPNFKPDYAKDELRAHNYVCHLTVFSRALLKKVGVYRPECDGSQDHDIVLRLTEQAQCIVHIPQILYFWRVLPNSVSAGVGVKSYAISAAHRAVAFQLERTNEPGKVASIPPYPSLYKVDYALPKNTPLISVIIYGISNVDKLINCVKAMEDGTTYYPMEVCLVEGGIDRAVFQEMLRSLPTVKPIRVLTREEQNRTTDALNLAVQACNGEYIVFLHSDTVINSKHWAKEMLMYAQRKDVGAIGCKVYDTKFRVYSGGIVLDREESSLLHYLYRGEPRESHGYEAGLCHVRNVTAVDGQCLMISKALFQQTGGLRENMETYRFVDLCLRLEEMKFWNVWTPFVECTFSGKEAHSSAGEKEFSSTWCSLLMQEDPYYNPNVKRMKIY